MTCYIAPVVEGQTEREGSVERLLQRVWRECLGRGERLQVLRCSWDHRSSLTHPRRPTLPVKVDEARKRLASVARRDPAGRSPLLVLLDAEGDCPKDLGPRLLGVATAAVPSGTAVSCVLATRMLENGIVAGCATLGGVRGLPATLAAPADPEACNGARWLATQLRSVRKNRAYDKRADALAFVGRIDLAECRARSPSFDKLCRELETHFPPPPPPPPDPPPAAGEPSEAG